jgi:hypothetical protein
MSNTIATSNITDYLSPIVPETTNYSLQKWIRQSEIEMCMEKSDPKNNMTIVECTRVLSGDNDPLVFAQGFEAVQLQAKQAKHGISGQLELTKWCSTHNPHTSNTSNTSNEYQSWNNGCYNGIRGIDTMFENILRPNEIQQCTYMNTSTNNNRLLPHTCACYNTQHQHICVNGYQAVRVENPYSTIEKHPDSLITWCLDNIPSDIKNNEKQQESWNIGCLNGIRGPHKIV